MKDVNKVILIGRLGTDVELKSVGRNDSSVANFSMATSKKWKNKDGSEGEKTQWHRVQAWGPLADICSKILRKGAPVYIEGEVEYSKVEGKGGEPDKWFTNINAREVSALSSKGESFADSGNSSSSNDDYEFVPDDDLPF